MTPDATKPTLIIVTGPPASGKTTFARLLGSELRVHVLSKDEVKEVLFTDLGWLDRQWSMKLGIASVSVLCCVAESAIRRGFSFIVESSFDPKYDTARFEAISSRVTCRVTQVHLTADPKVLTERFRQRVAAGERHPGHIEDAQEEELRENLRLAKWAPMDLPGALVCIDTTGSTAESTWLSYGAMVARAVLAPPEGKS